MKNYCWAVLFFFEAAEHVFKIISMKNKKQEVRIEQEQYLELQRCFSELLKQCTGVKFKINPEAWYDNQEIMQLLFISKRTAQHYRDSGLISFSQIVGKIYYKGADITSFIEGHYKKGKY